MNIKVAAYIVTYLPNYIIDLTDMVFAVDSERKATKQINTIASKVSHDDGTICVQKYPSKMVSFGL